MGFLARHEKHKALLQNRMGGTALASTVALKVLEAMLMADSPTLAVMEFDWRALSNALPTARTPKFREVATHSTDNDNSESNRADIVRLLSELSDEELHAAFIEVLKEELSQILLVAKEKINANQSMYEMGLDSLMGVELMVAIESRFNVQIPVMALSEAPTLSKLADRLIVQLRGDNKTEPSDNAADTQATIKDLSSRHSSTLSDEQLTALTKNLATSGTDRIIH